jgi:hypothetical protein
MRLHAQTAVIENGFVFVPEEAPWLADDLAELTTFPGLRAWRFSTGGGPYGPMGPSKAMLAPFFWLPM